jgi:purine nucleosidase
MTEAIFSPVFIFVFFWLGKLNVISLGPLTNIAIAMKADETYASRIKFFYIMGGNSEGIGNASISAEFNFLADPEAAYVMLNKAESPITMVPWELCYIHTKFSKVSSLF